MYFFYNILLNLYSMYYFLFNKKRKEKYFLVFQYKKNNFKGAF